MPLTGLMMANRERGPGDTLAVALARSASADARAAQDARQYARDPDEIAAAMVSRGYLPGMTSGLAQRIQDAESALAGARQKREDHAKAIQRYSALRDKGQISVLDAAQRMDAAEGPDEAEISRLEKNLERLQHRQDQAQTAITGAVRGPEDPLEAASRRAHTAFVEATRAMLAQAEAGQPLTAPRPFGSASRGGAAECPGPGCEVCAACPDGPCELCAADHRRAASRSAGEAARSLEHTGADCWVCAEGRKRDAARDASYSAPDSCTPGYLPPQVCSDCRQVDCVCGQAGARMPPNPARMVEVYR